MGAYAQLLIDQTDGSFEQIEKAMSIAMICWNLSLHPTMNDSIDASLAESGMPAEDIPLFKRDILEPMIRRHREMFPGLHSE